MQKFSFAGLAKSIGVAAFFVKKVLLTTNATILHIQANMGLLLKKSKYKVDCYN
ncbi:hypothetical protein [Pedobacter sp.]|uniref:hypothetical protein n=1 Tax=Pedobacter sp. TaxID=1411316 RepID=UPI0031DA447A